MAYSTNTGSDHSIADHSAEEYLSSSTPYQPPNTLTQYSSTQQNGSLMPDNNTQPGIGFYDSPPCNCSRLPTTHLHRYPLRRWYPTPSNYQRDRANVIEPHVTEPPLQSNQLPPWAEGLYPSLPAFLQANVPGTLHGNELIKINSNVTEDKVWSETVMQLPLELGEGYLPEDQPVEVPTGLHDISDYHTQFLSCDEDGPPPETSLFHCWQFEDHISDIIQQNESFSKSDYETIRSTMMKQVNRITGQYFENANFNFILPLA